MTSPLTVDSILGPEGRIARRLERYEPRDQQLRMARKVSEALRGEQHLVVEAGTGTGKSFAYLVPAILHATADQEAPRVEGSRVEGSRVEGSRVEGTQAARERKRRILISTHTISLQEQLIQKDLPLLNSVIPREFSAVLVKGRGNYVSLRRLQRTIAKATSLLSTDHEYSQLRAIQSWARSTTDGSLASLPIRPDPSVWDEVASDTGNCLRTACPSHKDCFYFRARRRAKHAELMIVNHALFFSDLAMRAQHVALLPDYDAVILDECHTLESVAAERLGVRLSSGQFDFLFDRLYNDRTQKGMLVDADLTGLQQMVERCRFSASNLFADILDWWEVSGTSNGRVHGPRIVDDPLSGPMQELALQIQRHAEGSKDAAELADFQWAQNRLNSLAASLRGWIGQEVSDSVYWLERSGSQRSPDRITLAASPINVGQSLRQVLFHNETIRSVVMTSATLATGKDDRFEFFRARVGLSGGLSLRVGSPFDYKRQARVVVVRDLPDPSKERDRFDRAIPPQVKRFVELSDGHAFVLFTSYDLLRRCVASLSPWLTQQGMEVYSQAGAQSRTQMLDGFRRTSRSVLFGTDSFWQGVDVPGDSLTNVIITKLPFSVPDHPLLEARLESIRTSGGNPFSDYQLPEAVIKFRQGFGRLIRTVTDRGMVVVLDPRIETKSYGRAFLEALPPAPVQYVASTGDLSCLEHS